MHTKKFLSLFVLLPLCFTILINTAEAAEAHQLNKLGNSTLSPRAQKEEDFFEELQVLSGDPRNFLDRKKLEKREASQKNIRKRKDSSDPSEEYNDDNTEDNRRKNNRPDSPHPKEDNFRNYEVLKYEAYPVNQRDKCHELKNGDYKCPECVLNFYNAKNKRAALTAHYKKFHKNSPQLHIYDLTCKHCNTIFYEGKQRQEHVRQSHAHKKH